MITVNDTLPEPNSPEYAAEARSGATRETLIRNLVEANFYGLRRLQAYLMAGEEKRKSFTQVLAQGRAIESCPFPFEVALLRALHMGMARWCGAEPTLLEQATAFVSSLRFGVLAPHLTGVIEYESEVFFRAFQGVEVHRDVSYLEDSNDYARSIDWMDYRIYQIPSLEKDLVWDLFQMNLSPWANPHTAISLADASLPEQRERCRLPMMVARRRNRDNVPLDERTQKPLCPLIGMGNPGASLHLCLVSGNATELGELMPALVGIPTERLSPPALPVTDLRNGDHWLVVTYQPPPPLADARMFFVPPQLDTLTSNMEEEA